MISKRLFLIFFLLFLVYFTGPTSLALFFYCFLLLDPLCIYTMYHYCPFKKDILYNFSQQCFWTNMYSKSNDKKKHVLKTVVFCAFFRVLFSPRHVWAEFEKSEPARSNRILDNFLTVVLSRYLKLYHHFSFYSENILKATELNDFNRMI